MIESHAPLLPSLHAQRPATATFHGKRIPYTLDGERASANHQTGPRVLLDADEVDQGRRLTTDVYTGAFAILAAGLAVSGLPFVPLTGAGGLICGMSKVGQDEAAKAALFNRALTKKLA